jgi:hypothetical protein
MALPAETGIRCYASPRNPDLPDMPQAHAVLAGEGYGGSQISVHRLRWRGPHAIA